MLVSFITWNVSPAVFTLPVVGEIRWYGIAFVLGFMLGLWIVQKIWKHEQLNEDWYDKLFFFVIIATVIGARLGHILFYNPGYYFAHPIEIFNLREGGLASHGGTLGIIVAIWIYSKTVTRQSMLWTFDRLVVPVGFVAALIRLGNLMNHEVYGHATNLPWAFRFIENIPSWQTGYAPIYSAPSHPTQLYEAFCYILTAFACLHLYWKNHDYKYKGLIFGVFLIGIFLSRFFIEFLKNNQESFEEGMILNMGQLLSIPFIIAGFWFVCKGLKEKRNALAKTTHDEKREKHTQQPPIRTKKKNNQRRK